MSTVIEVTEDGKVFEDGMWLRPSVGTHGYEYVNIDRKSRLVHRLVAEAFLGAPSEKQVVNHKDGNKLNNAVGNLEWVSYSENVNHMYRQLGVAPSRGRRTITDEEALEVIRLIKTTSLTNKEVSEITGVSRSKVMDIKRGRAWSHLIDRWEEVKHG